MIDRSSRLRLLEIVACEVSKIALRNPQSRSAARTSPSPRRSRRGRHRAARQEFLDGCRKGRTRSARGPKLERALRPHSRSRARGTVPTQWEAGPPGSCRPPARLPTNPRAVLVRTSPDRLHSTCTKPPAQGTLRAALRGDAEVVSRCPPVAIRHRRGPKHRLDDDHKESSASDDDLRVRIDIGQRKQPVLTWFVDDDASKCDYRRMEPVVLV